MSAPPADPPIEDFHVEESGSGPTLLLQHGLAGSARNWGPQVRALRERYRLVRFDARGHARTAKKGMAGRHGLAEFVGDFGRIADAHAGAEPFVAGGLSLGAAVALHHALAAPERVRGLVLAAIAPGRGAGAGFTARADAFAAAIDTRGLDAAGEEFVWGPRSGLDPGAAKLVRQGFLEHPPEALAAILRETIAELPRVGELADSLRELRIPTLVVVGTADRGSLDPCRELADRLPEATLVEIEGAGHVVNLAAPAAFNEALEAFLARLG